ncbi:phosphatase PAP2 family protein [Varibaculum vaginae]|uniref:phosphatase PAP2 family protein n=1 Tax=Varibaculum vaginae TaxID=2364797 RepID=UPI000F07BD41|nr:phosphatase PAP2 family protein [Varibaculum vaginae]
MSSGVRSSLTAGYVRRFSAAFLAALLLVACYLLFVRTRAGQATDTLAMFALSDLNRSFAPWDQVLLREWYLFILLPLIAVAVIVALVRRRFALGARMLVMVVAATVTTQVLKHLVLSRPALGITYYMTNSFPSGHTTAAGAAAVALVMVAADRWREVATYLSALVLWMVALAVVVARWHRPSDVFAAIGVVAVFALLLSPLELGGERGKRALRRGRIFTPFAAAIALVGVVMVAYCYYQLAKGGNYFMVGSATADLSQLAKIRHPLALMLAGGTVLSLGGVCWIFVFEVARAGMRPQKSSSLIR